MKKSDWFVYNRKFPIDDWFNNAYICNSSCILLCKVDTIRDCADFVRDCKWKDTHYEVINHREIQVSYYIFQNESTLVPVPDGKIPKVFSTKFDDFSLKLFESHFTNIPSIMNFDPTSSIRMIKIITANILE